ncbi:MAG TPA: HD domain-containing protein [Candidatus Limnocylindrales bacterium]|nr:HD domain-containing protein [Candidatus Limnocylindrales bacterium]
MAQPRDPAQPQLPLEVLPPLTEVEALSRELLGSEGTRLAHVRTAGFVASRLAVLFDPEEAELLVAAATLHDIGYSPRIAHTGFHPLDGGVFLRAEGYPDRLARLVANHSLAVLTADEHGIHNLVEQFPREDGLLPDALAYADMHSAPDGQIIPVERRLADITRRHDDRVGGTRAGQLRAAMTRVGAALLAAQQGERVGPPTHADVVEAHRRRWVASLHWSGSAGYARTMHGNDASSPGRGGDPLSAQFDVWWSAEAQYSLELERYSYDSANGPGAREAALRLAHLRSRADLDRDRFFRQALR